MQRLQLGCIRQRPGYRIQASVKVKERNRKSCVRAAALLQVVLHPALEPPRLALAAWAWLGVLLALAGLVVLFRVTTSDPGLLPRGSARTNGLCAQVPPGAPGRCWASCDSARVSAACAIDICLRFASLGCSRLRRFGRRVAAAHLRAPLAPAVKPCSCMTCFGTRHR